jgi:hypothetical protein
LRGDIAVRVCRAVLSRWGNPQPAPKEPTDEEITDLLSWSTRQDWQDQGPWPTQVHCVVRVALQLWGSPPIEPVPVSERLPGPEGDCDAEVRCWWGDAGNDEFVPSWRLCKQPDKPCFTHWLPHWALPVPSSPTPETPC